jgi:hypothetical protein
LTLRGKRRLGGRSTLIGRLGLGDLAEAGEKKQFFFLQKEPKNFCL